MPYREAKIYDRDFPAMTRVMVGDPTVKGDWPQEVWRAAVGKDEFAVLVRHIQTNHLLMPDGKRPPKQGSELCLVFDDLEEARKYSRQLVGRTKHVLCLIYDGTGSKIEGVRDRKGPIILGVTYLLGLLMWGTFFCGVGLAIIFAAYELLPLALGHRLPAIGSYPLWGWLLLGGAGLFCGMAVCFAVLFFKTQNRAQAMRRKLTPEEWNNYSEELNRLQGSSDPEDHARYTVLWNEIQKKLRS